MNPPQIHTYHAAWNPYNFIYMEGSLVTGNPTLDTSTVNPKTHTTTHIEFESQPERHTINKAEQSTITIA